MPAIKLAIMIMQFPITDSCEQGKYLQPYNKTNEMHQFLTSVFGIELYMFQTGFLSIIRSLVLYTQQ